MRRRGDARRRLADLPARHAALRRAKTVHLIRHHQAGEVEEAAAGRRHSYVAMEPDSLCRLCGQGDSARRSAGTNKLPKSTALSEIEAAPAPQPAPSPAEPRQRNWRDYALLLALACCWSSTYPLTKIGLVSIPPITFISARSLIAALFLLVVLRIRGLRLPTDARAWKLFAQQQTINSTIPFLMITWAQQYVPASTTVVLASTTPIFAFLITWGITRHEPATLLKLVGAILGLAGTAAIIGLDALGGLSSDLIAEMAILLATVSFACATIFGLRLSESEPMVVAAGSLLFGGCVLLPLSLILEHPWTLRPTPQALAAAATMGIFSSALGLMLFYMCLQRLGTITTNAQGYLRIPIGVGLSVLLLGESVPQNLALGLVLVMAGVAAMTVPGDALRRAMRRLRGCQPLLQLFLISQQLLEFLDVARDELLEHIGRVLAGVRRDGGEIGKTFFHRLALDGGLRRSVELRDDIGWRALGREQAVPALRLEIGEACF